MYDTCHVKFELNTLRSLLSEPRKNEIHFLTLSNMMDFPIHINTIGMGLPILY